MAAADTSRPPLPDVVTEPLNVSVQGANVLVLGPASAAFTLTAEAAVRSAERLLEAAEQAQADAGKAAEAHRPKPPFPPSDLVSPNAG
jgi:hypothetical protein